MRGGATGHAATYTEAMAAVNTKALTLAEFRERYAAEKPYYEYWFGEAVQKSVPTVLHVLLVKILLDAIERAGYLTGPELELRSDPDWQPKADVAGWIKIDGPYPTKPVEVVAEVVSPEDRMQRVLAKCRQYERIGTQAIFVFDPEFRDAWEWSLSSKNLERISSMMLPNGSQIQVDDLWSELDRKLNQ